MEEIKASDIMLGNWFRGYDNKPFQWNFEHFALLTLDKKAPTVDEIIKCPIFITEDILLNAGFEKQGMAYVNSILVIDKFTDGRFWYIHRMGNLELMEVF